jgi:hypothetical protein
MIRHRDVGSNRPTSRSVRGTTTTYYSSCLDFFVYSGTVRAPLVRAITSFMCNARVSDLHAEAVEQNVDLAPAVTRGPTLLLFKIDLDHVDGIAYNVASKGPCT